MNSREFWVTCKNLSEIDLTKNQIHTFELIQMSLTNR